ncbi:Uncharacterised protein [Burkholderia cenocepacia]|nr:Uncharacterised protein [Burkholderia cenocepacia]
MQVRRRVEPINQVVDAAGIAQANVSEVPRVTPRRRVDLARPAIELPFPSRMNDATDDDRAGLTHRVGWVKVLAVVH